jgi:uncharacterized protein (DUF697 family)
MEPVSFATATLLLWTITLYGVLFIVTVFGAWAHARQRSRFGARALRVLALADAGAAAFAPVVVGVALGAPTAAAAVAGTWLALAILCHIASRLELREPGDPVPRARVVQPRATPP